MKGGQKEKKHTSQADFFFLFFLALFLLVLFSRRSFELYRRYEVRRGEAGQTRRGLMTHGSRTSWNRPC